MYEIYLRDSSKPIWSYKHYTTLRHRLRVLAHDTVLSGLQVRLDDGEAVEWVTVEFVRNRTFIGWRCEQGIPTPRGTRVMEDLTPNKPSHLLTHLG